MQNRRADTVDMGHSGEEYLVDELEKAAREYIQQYAKGKQALEAFVTEGKRRKKEIMEHAWKLIDWECTSSSDRNDEHKAAATSRKEACVTQILTRPDFAADSQVGFMRNCRRWGTARTNSLNSTRTTTMMSGNPSSLNPVNSLIEVSLQ